MNLASPERTRKLIAFRQTPPHIFLIEDSGLNPAIPVDFAKIMDNHLKLLTLNPVIQQRFQSEPRWLELYGLPVSYADFGPVQVLRAQRQVFQVWTVDGGGGPKGLAVLANGGDLAKEFGLIPEPAIDPVEAVNVVPRRSADRAWSVHRQPGRRRRRSTARGCWPGDGGVGIDRGAGRV